MIKKIPAQTAPHSIGLTTGSPGKYISQPTMPRVTNPHKPAIMNIPINKRTKFLAIFRYI